MPWARRPISLPNEKPQSFLYWGRWIRCRYSRSSPVSSSITAPAKSAKNCNGYAHADACLADGQLPAISMAASRALVLALVRCDGPSSSWETMLPNGLPLSDGYVTCKPVIHKPSSSSIGCSCVRSSALPTDSSSSVSGDVLAVPTES